MISDQDIVAGCSQGSQDAFRRLVDKHWAGVVRTVSPLLGDPDDVEDAAQEAFIRACRRLDELKDPDRLPAWLHAIARNAARKMLRQRRLEQQRLPEYELSRSVADPDLGSLLGYRDLKALVNTLAPPDRAVVTLFYLTGMELNRIAERLDIPVGTAKSRFTSQIAQTDARKDPRHDIQTPGVHRSSQQTSTRHRRDAGPHQLAGGVQPGLSSWRPPSWSDRRPWRRPGDGRQRHRWRERRTRRGTAFADRRRAPGPTTSSPS